MTLSSEERRKIYEEEKALIEAEQQRDNANKPGSITLPQNVAGLLSYLGFWISGIIFLVLEQNNKFIRFHALQSIIVFGALIIVSAILSWIPYAGGVLGTLTGVLTFILWIVLMFKAYHGERYKVFLAGDIAESILYNVDKPEYHENRSSLNKTEEDRSWESKVNSVSVKHQDAGKRVESYFKRNRIGRKIGYVVSIIFNIIFIVMFTLYYEYIAWYSLGDDGNITRLPLLTDDYLRWLPVLVTSLVISIAANIILIIFDRYWFRESVQIILEIIGLAVVVYLLVLFPFNFSAIPDVAAADIALTALRVVLILVSIGFGVSALIRFVKLIFKVEDYQEV